MLRPKLLPARPFLLALVAGSAVVYALVACPFSCPSEKKAKSNSEFVHPSVDSDSDASGCPYSSKAE